MSAKRVLVVVTVLAMAVLTVTPAVGFSRLGEERRGIAPRGPAPATAADDGPDADDEGSRYADQTINDDLVVSGSICGGFDCANNEAFGFDTLRLKENNLRIRALDTSSSASFPSQDWQLVFNDSNDGGLNRFSVEGIAPFAATPFTLEAGDNEDALYVDDLGRVGLGTDNPGAQLHMVGSDTPVQRFEQTVAGGFGAQIWDVAANETNFFVRDVTNAMALPLRILTGAPHNSVYVSPTGNVGLGTGAPSARLSVNGDATVAGSVTMADPVQPAAPEPGAMYFDGNTFCGWDGTAWRSLQTGGDTTCS